MERGHVHAPAPGLPAALPYPHWSRGNGWMIIGVFVGAYLLLNGAALVLVWAGAPPIVATLTTIGGALLAAAGSVGLMSRRTYGYGWADLGVRPVARRWLWLAVGIGLLMVALRVALLSGLVWLVPGLRGGVDTLATATVNRSSPLTVGVTLGMISVVAPLWEELFFRGFLFAWLRERWSVWPAILVSALCFGLIHLIPLQIVGATVLGVGLAWVYERSRSLWPVLIVHVVNNAVLQLTLYLITP